MFTSLTSVYHEEDVLVEAVCLSTDTKPTTGIANGSTCLEMDTSTLYIYDEANETWRAW